jgi:hypothetical protein
MSIFRSKDFYVSAYLLTLGHTLKTFERSGKVTTFIFVNDHKLLDDLSRFYSSETTINPMKYSQSIRSIKAMLYANEDVNNVNHYQPQN